MGYYRKFKDILEDWLKAADRKPAWLAKRIDVTPNTVSRWINDLTRPESPDLIVLIADALGRKEADCEVALKAAEYYITLDQIQENPKTIGSVKAAIASIRQRSLNPKTEPTPPKLRPDPPTSASEKTKESSKVSITYGQILFRLRNELKLSQQEFIEECKKLSKTLPDAKKAALHEMRFEVPNYPLTVTDKKTGEDKPNDYELPISMVNDYENDQTDGETGRKIRPSRGRVLFFILFLRNAVFLNLRRQMNG